jgi:hypothetical protein
MNKYSIKIVLLSLVAEVFVLFLSNTLLFAAEKKGTLTGSVRYFGKTPLRESGPVNIDQGVCGSEYLEESLVNTENKGVKNAVINLKRTTDRQNPSVTEERFYLVTKQCHFEPYVTVVQTDNSLRIKNSDPILHVLKFSREDQVLFTLPLPANGTIDKIIDHTGLIEIQCVIHPYMKSFIAVVDTPIYALSDQNGSFHFSDLNPGKYSLSIWHKSFGSIEKEIEIVPGKMLNLAFELEQK